MKTIILFVIISVFASCQNIKKDVQDVNDDNKSRPIKGLDLSSVEIILIIDSLEDK